MDMPRADMEPGVEQALERKSGRATLHSEKREMVASKFRKIGPLFLITVIFPTLLAALYFGFIASDVYISESRFTVRSPEKSTPTGLGALFKSTGFANAGDEIYAAQDYVLSRDALKAVNRNRAFIRAYSDPSVSAFNRFGGLGSGSTFEDLYKYYKKKVDVKYETSSSIVTLTVRAFTAKDAARFNEQLLEMAETTVNTLNERARQDLIRFAEREVSEAKAKSQRAALALSAYRNAVGIVDPERQATVQIQMISKLQDELIATRTQLTETRTVSPQNPQIEVLAARAQSLSSEIDKQLGQVAGSSKSLSSRAAQYQRVLLENQFADKQLASAMASLDEARNEANRKQAYVERIVQPNVPDEPLEPRRWRGILSTLILGLAAWAIISMLVAGMLEHRD
jgi:capsular polysaccharide transport system permease protein